MEKQEVLKFLRDVANQPATLLTKEERTEIAKLANKHGVAIKKRGCASCYVDAAVAIYQILMADEVQEDGEEKESERQYVLKSGTNILFNGIHVNEATLTDEKAAALVKAGLGLHYFAKYPNE